MAKKKILSQNTRPNTKLVLVIQEPLLYLEFNKPNNQNVYEINRLRNSTFLGVKIDVDKLINVKNAKHQNITS